MLDTFYTSNEEKFNLLENEIDLMKDDEGSLIMVMQIAQTMFGYLPIEVQLFIADKMNVALPEVYGVATFYSQFKILEQGKNAIGVCQGTACYVKGSKKIQDEIEKQLDVLPNETTSDKLFTLNETRCVGACGLAPVVMINDDAHGRLEVSDIDEMLSAYKNQEEV